MKKILIFITFSGICLQGKSQQVGIGTTTPDASSMLEIKSNSKGLLLPRMTSTDREAIINPSTGLLIYQNNNTPGFYYYSGTAWTGLVNHSLSNLKATTAVNVDILPGNTNSVNLGSANKAWKNVHYTGDWYLKGKHIFGADDTTNTFLGISAGNTTTTGSWNTAMGNLALSANTSGNLNTAIGNYSLFSNTEGNRNSAIGHASLATNSTGSFNTANGYGTLYFNEYGSFNTAVGNNALYFNKNGNENVAVGYNALYANTSGYNNCAIGTYVLRRNTTGDFNVAIGNLALDSNTAGNNNVAIGLEAGYRSKVENNNTFIGSYSGPDNEVENSVFLGYNAGRGFAFSNAVYVGNSSTTIIGGQVGWSQYSDGRMKKNIKSDVPGLAFINKLNPVTYHLDVHRQNELMMVKGEKDTATWKGKYDVENKKMTGFVAQDVDKAARELGYDFSGVSRPVSADGMYSLTYSEFVVPLVKAVQELSKANDEKDSRLDLLQKQVDELKAILNTVLQKNK